MKTFKEFINEAQVRFSKDSFKDIIPDDILDKLIGCDTSANKSYVKWIINGYLKSENKKLYLEDLDDIRINLDMYEKYKKKNLINKDIYTFKNYKDLYSELKKVGGLGEPTTDETYLIKDRYYINNDEAEIFYEDKNYLIVIPKTYNASKFYASNTKWCTRFPDQYKEYSSKGNLYIIINKNLLNTRDKFRLLQFHFEEAQFMDRDDVKIDREMKISFSHYFKNIKYSSYLKYDWMEEFVKGQAVVYSDGKKGVVNDKGKEIVPLIYDNIGLLHYDRRIVGKDGKYGLINGKGDKIIPLKYNRIDQFDQTGLSLVNISIPKKRTGKGWLKFGVINLDGEEIVTPKYDNVKSEDDDYYIVRLDKGDKKYFGVIKNNKIIIPIIYDGVVSFTDTGVINVDEFNGKEDGRLEKDGSKVTMRKIGLKIFLMHKKLDDNENI